jgi:hypothetical protein
MGRSKEIKGRSAMGGVKQTPLSGMGVSTAEEDPLAICHIYLLDNYRRRLRSLSCLSAEEVEKLREVAHRILVESEEYQRLSHDLR